MRFFQRSSLPYGCLILLGMIVVPFGRGGEWFWTGGGRYIFNRKLHRVRLRELLKTSVLRKGNETLCKPAKALFFVIFFLLGTRWQDLELCVVVFVIQRAAELV